VLRAGIWLALNALYHVETRSREGARNNLGLMKTKIERNGLPEELIEVNDLVANVKSGDQQRVGSNHSATLGEDVRKLLTIEVNDRIEKHDTGKLVVLEVERAHVANDELHIAYPTSRSFNHR
jgi:hypothetical protein